MNLTEFIPTMSVAGILAIIAPLAAQTINKLTFSAQIKQLVAVAVSIIFAVFALVATDGISLIPHTENPAVWVCTLILVVIAISQLAYQLIWKRTGVIDKIAVATATKSELRDARGTADGAVPTITDLDAPQHRATKE